MVCSYSTGLAVDESIHSEHSDEAGRTGGWTSSR